MCAIISFPHTITAWQAKISEKTLRPSELSRNRTLTTHARNALTESACTSTSPSYPWRHSSCSPVRDFIIPAELSH